MESDNSEQDDVVTIDTLKAEINRLENELAYTLSLLRLSDTKITKLQDSEFRLEELLSMGRDGETQENKRESSG